MSEPNRTPLYDLHAELGGRMVPFAGYLLPVQYPAGILKEHGSAREAAALFDVSHMGQMRLGGPGVRGALERLVPADVAALGPGRARYTQFTAEDGGILDDCIVTAVAEDELFLVVNAARKTEDEAHLRANLPDGVTLEVLDDRALLALQGPAAAGALATLAPEAAELVFMESREMAIGGQKARVSRLGYTGEDGFEVSYPAAHAQKLARTLLAHERVQPAGLGARDSLRLEAGLCLYGHDIDATTSPVEAGLAWTIGRRRREAGGFAGAGRILRELEEGPKRRLVGVRVEGRAPVREGAEVYDGRATAIGRVTSGGFGPTVGAPVAMGYVAADRAAPGTPLRLEVRGRTVEARVAPLPFVPHRYHTGRAKEQA
ncbi:MAG: glycine cleavage system aminomethyltransferase GcvT [Geminicoccaceae bacterium]|nr:glycine cleavage system aminomethyltransferase GcvT [Geminicoccaceae bacterium]